MALSSSPSERNEVWSTILKKLTALVDESQTNISWSQWGGCAITLKPSGDIQFYNAASNLIATITSSNGIIPCEPFSTDSALRLLAFNFPEVAESLSA